MSRRWIWMNLLAVAAPAYGQLYLMTGSPTPLYNQHFASTLFQVGDDGSVRPAAQLVPKEIGTWWITISYDLRKALLLADQVVVVDFDEGPVVKRYQFPAAAAGFHFIDKWLLDVPGKGAVFAEYFADDSRRPHILGIALDASVPSEENVFPLEPSELKYLVAHGHSGVADVGSHDSMLVASDAGGEIARQWVGGGETAFGYKTPSAMLAGVSKPISVILINNRDMLVLSVSDQANIHDQRLIALRKSDKTWHRIAGAGERLSWARGFGTFIALAEASTKGVQAAGSAGRDEWRMAESKMGPSINDRLNDAKVVFPGRLHLYDIDSGHLYTVATNQGDSEILLVDNSTVYYRVSDRLYAAPITDKGVGTARLLATADAVRDAHWAFTTHLGAPFLE